VTLEKNHFEGLVKSINKPSIISPTTQIPNNSAMPIPVPIAAPACSHSSDALLYTSEEPCMPEIIDTIIRILNKIKDHLHILPKNDLLGFLNGAAHDGQSKAVSETSLPHSGHDIIAIFFPLNMFI
jgi:hypothetical protein